MGSHQNGYGIEVAVCYATPQQAWQQRVYVPAGASIRQAIEASEFRRQFPDVDPYEHGVGIFGTLRDPQFPLRAGDRVEIYRPLVFDPMESRRRRARHRAVQKGG